MKSFGRPLRARIVVHIVLFSLFVFLFQNCGQFQAISQNESLDTGLSVNSCAEPTSSLGMHQLTNLEYSNTVNDLFGTNLDLASNLPDDSVIEDIANASGYSNVSSLTIQRQLDAADQVVAAVFANTTARAKVVTCDPAQIGYDTCARQIITRLVERGFRRPELDGEIDSILNFMKTTGSTIATFDAGLGLVIQYIVSSPYLSYRIELDPLDLASHTSRPLNSFELAQRMSYFLTGTMPDDTLYALAKANQLQDPTVLQKEAHRLLAQPRAQQYLESRFFESWLNLSAIQAVTPDTAMFPQFTSTLKTAMYEEAEMLASDIVTKDLPISSLLNPGFTYVNGELAQHYGLSGITGDNMQYVSLPSGSERNGLLTQAGYLTMTSHSDSTSIVLRGKYVLERLLCSPPPPPPAVNETQQSVADVIAGVESGRLMMENHVSNPQCASCHAVMDPIGFGLENFDAVGQFRTYEHNPSVVVNVWAKVFAPSMNSDSIFAALDTQDFTANTGFAPENVWTWVKFAFNTPIVVKGAHTLSLRNRVPGVRIDRFIITTDNKFDPRVSETNSTAETYLLEAETPTATSPVFGVGADSTASGGKYLTVLAQTPETDPTAAVDDVHVGVVSYDFSIMSQGVDIPINPVTRLPTGEAFANADQLQKILVSKAKYYQCANQKLASFALAAPEVKNNTCSISKIASDSRANGSKFSTMIDSIVMSNLFRTRNKE